MRDRPQNENLGTARRSRLSSTAQAEERRSGPRKPFIAETQAVEIGSGAKISGRSCDLSVHGCYVDTLNPFCVGTNVRIRLKKGGATVEARGKVVYRATGLGMGISFTELAPESRSTLDVWLSQVDLHEEEEVFETPRTNHIEHLAQAIQQNPSGQFAELVQMLTRKGILTAPEADFLLTERGKK